jgi:uncharacterized protein (DUF885 family)
MTAIRLLAPLSLALALAITEVAAAGSSDDQLREVVDSYFEQLLELNPLFATSIGDRRFDGQLRVDIGPEHRRRALELEETALESALDIEPRSLTDEERLTREVFISGRRRAIEAARFPSHLLPIDHLQSLPVHFPAMGSGSSLQRFETVEDYDNWLARSAVWSRWVDQAIENLREGMERGIMHPWPVLERLIPILESQIVPHARDSVFFRPIIALPTDFAETDRTRLEKAFTGRIEGTIVPGYARLLAFVRDTYLPRARTTVGLDGLPGGEEWYRFLVRQHTTTDLAPREIHAIGTREVSRITSQIRRLQRQLGKSGPVGGRSTPVSLLDGYRDLQRLVEPRLRDLFVRLPTSRLEVEAVEPYRRPSAPFASYVPGSADGERPGRFYVNADETASGIPSDALFLHEALPGHHFQISIQRERTDLPRFRRFLHETSFVEGWALYAESLGEMLGLYRTPDQRLRALSSSLFRARRLVVDTGIHALGWSRGRAIEYLGDDREVDRYIAWPGQALAYKIGELEISRLRQRAEKRLGRRFDLRDFHQMVLDGGAMPLPFLERRVEAWTTARLESKSR